MLAAMTHLWATMRVISLPVSNSLLWCFGASAVVVLGRVVDCASHLACDPYVTSVARIKKRLRVIRRPFLIPHSKKGNQPMPFFRYTRF
jgi:hypothetical protein